MINRLLYIKLDCHIFDSWKISSYFAQRGSYGFQIGWARSTFGKFLGGQDPNFCPFYYYGSELLGGHLGSCLSYNYPTDFANFATEVDAVSSVSRIVPICYVKHCLLNITMNNSNQIVLKSIENGHVQFIEVQRYLSIIICLKN